MKCEIHALLTVVHSEVAVGFLSRGCLSAKQAGSRGLPVMLAVFPDLKNKYNASPFAYFVGKS